MVLRALRGLGDPDCAALLAALGRAGIGVPDLEVLPTADLEAKLDLPLKLKSFLLRLSRFAYRPL